MDVAADSQFHVLAVDDNIIDRKLIERLLKSSSFQVTSVDSGSKALQFLGLHADDQTNSNQPSMSPNLNQEVEVDLIITDYCMPGMTGFDLLKKVKKSSSLKDIPVVIMSSENVPSRISRCLEEDAEDFLLKPVRLSDVSKLKHHLMRTKIKDPYHQQPQEHQENNQEHHEQDHEHRNETNWKSQMLNHKNNLVEARENPWKNELLHDKTKHRINGGDTVDLTS